LLFHDRPEALNPIIGGEHPGRSWAALPKAAGGRVQT
jgi:hypothetical protein